MADEIIGAKVQVEGGAAIKTIGELRKEIKEANAELLNAQRNFGDYSEQALAAAKKLAQLKDSIQEARETADLFDPGQKFQAFSGALQSITGGFAAVQGAMGLLGVESKEVEAQLLKVQSALALSQGLSTITDSIKDFQRLGAILMTFGPIQRANALANTLAAKTMRLFGVATTQTGVAFNVLKGAIIATGIGALVVALGMAIQYLIEFAEAADKAAEKQKKFNESLVEMAQAGRDAEATFIDNQERLAVARANAEGKSAVEISKIQEMFQARRVGSLKRYYNEVGELDGKAKQDLTKAETDYEVKQLETQQKRREEAKKKQDEANAKAKAAADKAAAERKQNLEAALQAEQQVLSEAYLRRLNEEDRAQAELSAKYAERINAMVKAGLDTSTVMAAYEEESLAIYKDFRKKEMEANHEAEEKKRQDAADTSAFVKEQYNTGLSEFLRFAEDEKLSFDVRRKNLQDFHSQVMSDTDLTESDRTELERQYSDARKKINEQENAARIQGMQTVAGALDAFASVAGEQTAAGKAMSVAAAVISTILSAQQAFTAFSSTGPWGVALGAIAAAGALASGYARVRQILAVKIPGKSSGGSSPSLSGIGGGTVPSPALATTSITSAPVTPLMASGGSGMNDMLGQMRTTQEKNNKTLEDLNATLKGGLRANIMEGDIKSTNNRTASIEAASKL